MFILCEAMRWNHLPSAGGIYEQHPQLLDDFMIIWQGKGRAEKRKQALEKAKSRRKP